MYKNHNMSKQYVIDGSLSKGTIDSSRYDDISTSEFRVFDQRSKIDTGNDIYFGIFRSSSRLSEYKAEFSKTERWKR